MTETKNDREEPNKLLQYSLDYDAIVLSGGSVKGLALLGAVQYAYDNFLVKNVKMPNWNVSRCYDLLSFMYRIYTS